MALQADFETEAGFEGLTPEESAPTPLWLIALTAAIPLLLLIIAFNYKQGTMLSLMLEDPISAYQRRDPGQLWSLFGILSNLGVVMWAAAWAVTGFVSLIVFRSGSVGSGAFLLTFSFISGVLLADDALMMHERFYPRYFAVDENIVFIAYACLVVLWIVCFRATIRSVGPALLLLAFTGFALSIVGDLLERTPYEVRGMDGSAKLFGVFFWAAFAFRVSWVFLERDGNISTPPEPA